MHKNYKMKKILNTKLVLIVAFTIVLFGCAVNESPEFIGITNIKVVESTKTFITIKAEGLFKNLMTLVVN